MSQRRFEHPTHGLGNRPITTKFQCLFDVVCLRV
nr:MAG TPA: hypothetical protein [Caudoviricetes sp.]